MYSSLNYKDALGATGHAGVVSHFPHVPGIDAAGIVVNDASGRFAIGDRVIVTGFDLGAGRWGAYAEYIRVPADWVVPLPAGLSLRESMILGTAGFTAAMCLNIILHHGIEPDDGEVVVTGASGGVGTLAIALFAQSGFKVVAISGKPAARPLLQRLGAIEVLPRSAVLDDSNKSLLKPRWAAAVDTVGGLTLASMLRSAKPRGCVAACGLVGGADVPITVFPFILRGVTLAGVDSAWYPATRRVTIWSKLAGPWKPKLLEELAVEVRLDELDTKIEAILAGRVVGRIVVAIKTET
jgi:putative YhdH/YhfP family quinone oxidoreductase